MLRRPANQEDGWPAKRDGKERSLPVGLRVVGVAAEGAPLWVEVDDGGFWAIVLGLW